MIKPTYLGIIVFCVVRSLFWLGGVDIFERGIDSALSASLSLILACIATVVYFLQVYTVPDESGEDNEK